jgi:hypothetical protein
VGSSFSVILGPNAIDRVGGAQETIAVIYVETISVTYVDPCPSGATCVPDEKYWLPVGTVTLTPISTPTPPTAPALPFWNHPSYVFTNGQYFIGAYLPTVIAVLFAIPWLILDARVRGLEPFHELSMNKGAPGRNTLCIDYTSTVTFIVPFKALYARHWAPLLTSMLSISTVFITPLAPETVSIRMAGSCNATSTGCTPSLSAFPVAARATEAVLACMALMTLLLLLLMRQYNTGVFAAPFSIAGIATLFHHQHVLNQFRAAGRCSSKAELYRELANYHYGLDFYMDQTGRMRYGFVPLYQLPHHPETTYNLDGDADPGAFNGTNARIYRNP